MKQSDFLRWLRERGVSVENRKNHLMLKFGDKTQMLPRHPSKELTEGIRKDIIRDLGLKEK